MSSPDHMVDAQHKVSLAYWTAETNRAPETAGVAGMGGCGDLEVFYRHHEELDHLLKIVEFTPEKTVVELGCGTGRWVVSLAGRVKHYTGLDFSPTALAVVRRRAAELGLTNVTFLEGSAADFVPEGPIHVFYLGGVTQYLKDGELVPLLKRLAEKLAPGGVIIERGTLHRKTRTITDNADYFSIYRTDNEILELFGQAGLKCHYHQQSYEFLAFPWPVRKVLQTRLARRCSQYLAPGSYTVLRRLAALSVGLFGRWGDARTFTHDFFLFQPRS